MRRADIRSLCHQTELDILSFDAVIEERDEYLVVRSPTNPSHFLGNFVMYPAAPTSGDHERWVGDFRREFGDEVADRQHIAIEWDGTDGDVGDTADWVAAGFTIDLVVTQTITDPAQITCPPKYNGEVVVRPLVSDDDWAQQLENSVATREEGHAEEAYRAYAKQAADRYRAMIAAERGQWFGAFLGDRLAADCGLFVTDGRGRYQNVGTHPEFQRRGIAGRLVHDVARLGFEQMGASTLVIVALVNYHAAGLYEQVGFRPAERAAGALWFRRTA